MNLRFLPSAKLDAIQITDDLERMRSGWGEAFEEELRNALQAIASTPRSHPRTEDGPREPEIREYYIGRFELRVIFAFWNEELVLLAIIHAKRKPARWQHRLSELE